ncbi:unnamed protein product [Protopolystoma xenopodis]|uniref:Uncharacterized protein n=1 Tax=Protopolystoma xenopodis TaxID=117903 RepID=A0A3S5AWH0_9PLAT|nr:unnamed protein product [Protopolystoma xenopodis]
MATIKTAFYRGYRPHVERHSADQTSAFAVSRRRRSEASAGGNNMTRRRQRGNVASTLVSCRQGDLVDASCPRSSAMLVSISLGGEPWTWYIPRRLMGNVVGIISGPRHSWCDDVTLNSS